MKSTSLDIKSLTSELRNIATGKGELSQKKKDEATSDTCPDRSKEKSENRQVQNILSSGAKKGTEFQEIVNKINAKDQYNIDKFIYVDSGLHEVFSKLKLHTKLKLSTLVSHLLEEFLTEHKDAIKGILSQKQNKFLD